MLTILALKGSDHLEHILNNRLFQPISTKVIEDLYEEEAPDTPDFTFVTASQVEEGSLPREKLILTAQSHITVSKALEVPELSGEIERAVWQIENQFKKEQKEDEAAAAQSQRQIGSDELNAGEKSKKS